MALDFKPGCYSVKTGKTFLNPSDNGHDFYALQFNTTTLEPSLPSRKASLRHRKGTYYADWAWSEKVLSYEGTKGNLHELECLLVFDEDTHTFTLERPAVKTSMRRAQKKKPAGSASASVGNLYLPHPSKNKPGPSKVKPASSPIATTSSLPKKGPSSNGIISPSPATYDGRKTSPQLPMSLALPPPLKQQSNQRNDTQAPDPAPVASTSFDDVDISGDIDEILNFDDDDNDDQFETIIPAPMDPMGMELAPPSQSPQPSNMPSPSSRQPIFQTSGKRRRPTLKMASAPIRRLDASPPTPTLSSRPAPGHKTISATTHRSSTLSSPSSSSSSSSSDGSSSSDDGSSTDGSSDGSSDDDDMNLLVANISRGLSEEDTALSPQVLEKTTHPPHGGPRSLRDLLDGHHRDDDDVSSSGSSDEG